MKPSTNAVPRHIGIILDGNRRFAKRLMLKPWKGHEWGKDKVEKILEWAKECGVEELTLYAFSLENFNRPKEEFDYLMKVFLEAFKYIQNDTRLKETQIDFIGHRTLFPQDIQKAMQELEEVTKTSSPYKVHFAMGYGGQQEIIDATIKIAQQIKEGTLQPKEVTKEKMLEALELHAEPDLIIRTGGEKRLSNFLTFQSAYSEFIFLEKFWPEFEKEDLQACIAEYGQRQRRFGK